MERAVAICGGGILSGDGVPEATTSKYEKKWWNARGQGTAKEGYGLRTKHGPWIARMLVLAALVVFTSIWTYRYDHSTSWGNAEHAAIRYGVDDRLVKWPLQSFSMQAHHRWHGVWLEPYFFFETPDYQAKDLHQVSFRRT